MFTRYQRSNQKLYIEEWQTIQCSQDIKGVIRSYTSKNDRQEIRHKRKNHGPQKTTQKPKDWATRNPLKPGVDSSPSAN